MIDYRNRDMSLKEYIEELVEMYKHQKRLTRFDENIGICSGTNCVLLSGGIEELAELVNAPIIIEQYNLEDAEYLSFNFDYKGVTFTQIRNKKEWEENKNGGSLEKNS